MQSGKQGAALLGFGRRVAAIRAPVAAALSFSAIPGAAATPRCDLATATTATSGGMTIGPIENLNPALPSAPSGVKLVTARGRTPAHCLVTGSVVTHAASDKTANFGLALPLAWNGKLLFSGCSGYCGVVFQNLPDAGGGGYPHDALARGYAVVATDGGHVSTPEAHFHDASWALLAPGKPDTEALTDYFHRAVHVVAAASKPFVQKWYSGRLQRAYYFGCSGGGREAMMEASLYPTDFDGYIAGAPSFDLVGQILSGRGARPPLPGSDAVIPPELLRLTDNLIYASCDALDGERDRLIQNPGRCSFRPESLLCEGDNGTACLTANQVQTLTTWFSAARDWKGRVVSHGFAVSDLYNDGAEGANLFRWLTAGAPPGEMNILERSLATNQPSAWTFMDQAMKYLVHRDPGFSTERRPPVNRRGFISDETLELIVSRMDAASSDASARLGAFIQADRKLILYHGYSDGWVSPFRTIRFYRTWAERAGGYAALGESARLFTVPGMYHCSHGPGPNVFDALGALEQWVEDGVAPDVMIATKYADDRPDRGAVLRTMPLCPFPAQARYAGEGDIDSAANWTCPPNEDLLRVGLNGLDAGLIGPTR